MAQSRPTVGFHDALRDQRSEMELRRYHQPCRHGAQLAGLWLLKVGLPRFGWLNPDDMGVAYARILILISARCAEFWDI
jgi:hypothetical protein